MKLAGPSSRCWSLSTVAISFLIMDIPWCRTAIRGFADSECENVQSVEMMTCLQGKVLERPSDPRTWLSVGKKFHELGDVAEAKLSYQNVIYLSPLSFLAAEAHLHRGIIHQSDGLMLWPNFEFSTLI